MKLEREYYQNVIQKIQTDHPFLNYTELSYEIILQEILNGTITNEDLILQEQVSALLNFSRTPVRDALLRLEREGYLTRNDKGSFRLYNGTLRDYMDFSEMRLILEPKTAALAARRATEEQLLALRENVEHLRELVAGKDQILNIMETDYAFHYLIAQASDNGYLQEILNRHKVKLTFNFRFVVTQDSIRKLYRSHYGIYQAIAAGEDDLAGVRMEKHLLFHTDRIRTAYDSISGK